MKELQKRRTVNLKELAKLYEEKDIKTEYKYVNPYIMPKHHKKEYYKNG